MCLKYLVASWRGAYFVSHRDEKSVPWVSKVMIFIKEFPKCTKKCKWMFTINYRLTTIYSSISELSKRLYEQISHLKLYPQCINLMTKIGSKDASNNYLLSSKALVLISFWFLILRLMMYHYSKIWPNVSETVYIITQVKSCSLSIQVHDYRRRQIRERDRRSLTRATEEENKKWKKKRIKSDLKHFYCCSLSAFEFAP